MQNQVTQSEMQYMPVYSLNRDTVGYNLAPFLDLSQICPEELRRIL